MLKNVKDIVERSHNRASFFEVIESIYPKLDWRYKLIERAYNDAKDAFRQVSREGGGRYFEHLRATTLLLILYLRVRDYKLIIVAILHDVVEDIPSWTIERIRDTYGEEIALLVDYMTKPKKPGQSAGEVDRIYHARFQQAPRNFFLIKLCDRLHNILTLSGCPLSKRLNKIEETRRYYLSYAEANQILIHELEEALSEVNLSEELSHQ